MTTTATPAIVYTTPLFSDAHCDIRSKNEGEAEAEGKEVGGEGGAIARRGRRKAIQELCGCAGIRILKSSD